MTSREEMTAKAAVAYLIDHIEYSDSYGVEGSNFMACFLCTGGGAPGVMLVHDANCPVRKCEKIAAEWVAELEADRADTGFAQTIVPAWDTMPHICGACRKPIENREDHVVATRLLHKDCTASSPGSQVVGQAIVPATYRIEHDGFEGVEIGSYTTLEGRHGVVLQQIGTKVVHVYGRKWLISVSSTHRGDK